jgi:hypothetical protein
VVSAKMPDIGSRSGEMPGTTGALRELGAQVIHRSRGYL